MKTKNLRTLAIAGTLLFGVTSAASDFMRYETVDGIGTITICDVNDSSKCITMQDMNLGASKSGTTCSSADTGACGNHYQRGNNHGFAPNFNSDASFPGGEGTGDTQEPNCANYGPLNLGYSSGRYDSSTFIRKKIDWCNPKNDNLRGGENDSQANNRGFDTGTNKVIDAENRRGPCDAGYHVPSAGEWGTLIRYWAGNYTGAGNSLALQGTAPLYKFTSNPTARTQFQSDFMIPFAGYRFYGGAKVSDVGSNAGLWSSSPDSTDARYFYMYSSIVIAFYTIERAYGLSVRCFKDSALGSSSSEGGASGGNSKIIVSIAALNSGQNTCSGEDFIFPAITAKPSQQVITLAKKFQCVFGSSASKAVTLALSGDLADGNGNVISGENVKLSNPEWTVQPAGLNVGNTVFSKQTFLGQGKTLFNKIGNKIGTAEGSGVEIEIIVPGGTPDGTYNGTLVLTY